MPRNVLLLAVVVAAVALALWGFGVLGPRAGGVGEGPDAEGGASDLATVADRAPAPGPADVAGLASGAPKVVARSRPPTVDGPRITGRVTDRAGKGVPQARVISVPDTATKPFREQDLGTPDCPAFDAVTDAEGRFAVAVSKDAPYHALIAEAAGFGPAVREALATYADVTIVLDPGAALVGTVSDADGTAIVGARLRLFTLLDLVRHDVETTTGDGGAWRLDGLPALSTPFSPRGAGLSMALEVSAEGFAPVYMFVSPSELEAGRERRRDVVLVRGASVHGRVLDADGDRPLAGARVVLWSSEGMAGSGVWRATNPSASLQAPWTYRPLGEATTDAEGRYAFEHVPSQGFHPVLSGMYGRRGQTLGFVGAFATGYVPRAEDVPVGRNGASWEIDVRVRTAALVTGRLVDAQGKPVPKATVIASVKGFEQEGSSWFPPDLVRDVALSWNWEGVGPDGRYRLAVPCDRSRPVDAKMIGRHPVQPGGAWSEEGDGSVTVSVTAGATVEAPDLVLRAVEAPAHRLRLVVRARDGRPVFGAIATLSPFGGFARTDAEGNVEVALPSGRTAPSEFRVNVRAPGFATAWVTGNAASVDGPTIEVTLEPGRRLTGRVVRDDGAPVTKGRVSVGDGRRPVAEVFPPPSSTVRQVVMPVPAGSSTYGGAAIDKDGRFAVEDLPEGPYHVAAWPGDVLGSTTSAPRMGLVSDVPTGATDVEVRLSAAASIPTGAIEGRVVDATTKRPVPGVSVVLRNLAEPASAATAAPAGFVGRLGSRAGGTSPGAFEATDVAAGTWTLSISADGYRPLVVENVVVRDGETTRVGPVEMDRGVRVRGRFRVPDGLSLKERVASFSEVGPPAGGRLVQVPVQADGAFEGTGFTAGTWRVISFRQGSGDASDPPLVAPLEQPLVVGDREIEVAYDVALVAAGYLDVRPLDERLPPPPWQQGASPTEAQTRFGEGARIVVKGADGRVAGEQKGLRQQGAGTVSSLLLPPGAYVVRYEAPGDEPREASVTVRPGARVAVEVSAKGVGVPPPPPPAASMTCGAGKCG